MTVLFAFAAALLFATGTWMLLQRRLSRILIGVGLVGHGSNLLLLTSGGPGGSAPIIGTGDPADFSDPMPQSLALTSIVITFGIGIRMQRRGSQCQLGLCIEAIAVSV